MKKLLCLLGLVGLVVGIGLFARARHRDSTTRAEIAALGAQSATLRGRIAQADARAGAAQELIAAAAKAEPAAAVTQVSGAGGPAPGRDAALVRAAPPARQLTARSLIVNDPQRRAERARNFRESLDLSYGPFFKACNLTPEQIEKVKDLKLWYDQSLLELDAVAEAEGLLIRGPEYMKLKGELEGTRRRKTAELFDPLGLSARFNDFERLGLLRDTVQRIASIEMGSETPATSPQVNQAIDIIAAHATRPRVVWGWTWEDWSAINWDKAAPQLQAVLSPAQYTALRQYMRTKETWTTVMDPWGAIQTEARRLSRLPGK